MAPFEVSPQAFEVIRHRLMSINEENGNTTLTSSGSPVVVFGRDYAAALLTAESEEKIIQ